MKRTIVFGVNIKIKEMFGGGETMAKPIRATPVLRGKEAVRFVREVLREQKHPSKRRVKTIRCALASFEYFDKMLAKSSQKTSL